MALFRQLVQISTCQKSKNKLVASNDYDWYHQSLDHYGFECLIQSSWYFTSALPLTDCLCPNSCDQNLRFEFSFKLQCLWMDDNLTGPFQLWSSWLLYAMLHTTPRMLISCCILVYLWLKSSSWHFLSSAKYYPFFHQPGFSACSSAVSILILLSIDVSSSWNALSGHLSDWHL